MGQLLIFHPSLLTFPCHIPTYSSLMPSTPPSTKDNNDHPYHIISPPNSDNPTHHARSTPLDRGPPDFPHNPNPSTFSSFSDALRYGVEGEYPNILPPIPLQSNHPILHPTSPPQGATPSNAYVESTLGSDEVLEPLPKVPKQPGQMDDLIALCLLAKL